MKSAILHDGGATCVPYAGHGFEDGCHAYVCRREGRYLFRARLSACLIPAFKSAFRISLRTADQKVGVRRAARIASWMMSVKATEDPKEALQALWPRLQALAVEPVRDEVDLVELHAFQATAFIAQCAVRRLDLKPNDVVAGWDEHFLALVRENGRASNALEKSQSVAAQLERKRVKILGEFAARRKSPAIVSRLRSGRALRTAR